jgi:hypothetical protein
MGQTHSPSRRATHPLRRLSLRHLSLGLALCLALPVAATAQQIGTVASSEPTLRGTPPGAATRTLAIGTAVVADETVQSSASGRGQLLFLDETTLSLAPNTTIVLDRFIYDPASGAGEMGLRLTEGALRFIGGRLSEGQEATIATPTGTIGIRGSTALVVHLEGRTIAIFVAGDRLCAVFDGRRSCTSRQGGVLGQDGYLGQVNPAYLAQILTLLDGAPVPGGAGAGAGLRGQIGPNDAPAGTHGGQYDDRLFEDDLLSDDLLNGLGFPGAPAPASECFQRYLEDDFGFDSFADFAAELCPDQL